MKGDNFYIAGIGASAGGHQALREFFQHLPEVTGVAFVVITHLLRGHVSILDQIVSKYTNMKVHRMEGTDTLRPDRVYVMPENVIAEIANGTLVLRPRPADQIVNKSIDIFFHSLAEECREKAIAIIFAGMGSDGLKGARSIHKHGGTVLVQDPTSTPFKSMPDSIINHDNPDVILPPAEMASRLLSVLVEKKAV